MSESFPVHDACFNTHIQGQAQLSGEQIRQLAASGVSLNTLDENGNAPIHVAINRQNHEAVKALIDLGARLNVLDEEGYAPLHLAALWGAPAITKLLLDAGAPPDTLCYETGTRLQASAAYLLCKAASDSSCDHAGTLKVLLAAGADPSLPGPSCNTPLHAACESDREDLVSLLLEAGSEVEATNDLGDTALLVAARRGGPAGMVARLLAAGANIDTTRKPSARDYLDFFKHLRPILHAHLAELQMRAASSPGKTSGRGIGL